MKNELDAAKSHSCEQICHVEKFRSNFSPSQIRINSDFEMFNLITLISGLSFVSLSQQITMLLSSIVFEKFRRYADRRRFSRMSVSSVQTEVSPDKIPISFAPLYSGYGPLFSGEQAKAYLNKWILSSNWHSVLRSIFRTYSCQIKYQTCNVYLFILEV